jgi:hypothetical protein
MRPRCTQTAASTGALLLVAACTFDPFGLGTEGETAPGMSTGGSSSTSTTGEPLDPTTSGSSTSTGDDTTGPAETTTGPACPDGCPPSAGWTVVGEAGEGVGYAVAADANNDVVVAGDRMQAVDPTFGDIWAGKFTGADGTLVWQMGRGGDVKREDFAQALAIAGDGTILVAGAIHETDVQQGRRVARVDRPRQRRRADRERPRDERLERRRRRARRVGAGPDDPLRTATCWSAATAASGRARRPRRGSAATPPSARWRGTSRCWRSARAWRAGWWRWARGWCSSARTASRTARRRGARASAS